MGFVSDVLFGDLVNLFDTIANDQGAKAHRKEIQARLLAKSRRDRSRDQRIAALEQERDVLEVTLAALVRLLYAKNIVTKDELESLAIEVKTEMQREKQQAAEEERRLAQEAPRPSRKKKLFRK